MSGERFARVNAGRGHSYTLDGHRVPGVTTVIGVLDKPALVNWAARETAAYADEHWAELSEVRSADRIDRLTKARFATNRRAIVRGNRVHALGERLARGEQIPTAEISPELRPWVEGYARLLDDWRLETLHTEAPLAHDEYRYAGTCDAVMTSPRLGTVLIDLKTSKSIYSEVALQLAAYRHATLALLPETTIGPRGGHKTSSRLAPMPATDGAYAIHIREDGSSLQPVRADQQVWEVFLHLLDVYDTWVRPTAYDCRDPDAYRPVGDPIHPEDHPTITEEAS